MAKATENTTATLDNLKVSTRNQTTAGAKESRDRQLQIITAEEKNMGPKLVAASSYMQAFEFQSYDPRFHSESFREKMFAEALEELAQTVKGFIKDRSNVSPTSTKSNMMTMYALAARLTAVSKIQEENGARFYFKPITMYDLISDVIHADYEIRMNNMTSYGLRKYIESGRLYIDELIYLVRLRHNFLPALAFGMAGADQYGNPAGLFKKLGVIIKSIRKKDTTPNLLLRNTSELRKYNDMLANAIMAKDLLKLTEDGPILNKTIKKILENIRFETINLTIEDSDELHVKELKSEFNQFKTNLENLLAN